MSQYDRLPGVYYDENVSYELTGVGSKIPIFIGVTHNTETVIDTDNTHKVDGTQVLKFTSYDEINKTITNGGIGVETVTTTSQNSDKTETTTVVVDNITGVTTTSTVINATGQLKGNVTTTSSPKNLLLNRLKEFYQEAKLLTSDDVGVPYVYVIDVGTGADYNVWKNAIKTAKTLHDATVEVYIGATWDATEETAYICKDNGVDTSITELLATVYNGFSVGDEDELYGLSSCAKNLDLRYAFATVEDITDDGLIGLTNDFKYSRIGIAEPLLFGKTIARICCTPNNTEPGYFTYRSVSEGTFNLRSKADMLKLQNAGIIFNSDEHINGKVYPKMNLCLATSFSKSPKPADSLFHARFNADDLLREVFEACYNQVKANESATNIAYLQTRINKIINDRVTAEEMIKWNDKTEVGTKLVVSEAYDNPFNIYVKGQIQPVKCTIAIDVQATITI